MTEACQYDSEEHQRKLDVTTPGPLGALHSYVKLEVITSTYKFKAKLTRNHDSTKMQPESQPKHENYLLTTFTSNWQTTYLSTTWTIETSSMRTA
jgi:hypothetical protein